MTNTIDPILTPNSYVLGHLGHLGHFWGISAFEAPQAPFIPQIAPKCPKCPKPKELVLSTVADSLALTYGLTTGYFDIAGRVRN